MRYLLFLFALMVVVPIAGAQTATQSPLAAVEAARAKKAKEWKEFDSMKRKDRKRYGQLTYYPFSEKYVVEAQFTKVEDATPFKMKTSTKRLPEYVKYGEITFTLDGKELVLNVYQNVKFSKMKMYANDLFVPFTDNTNGTESYGGGRFLDIQIPEGESLTVNFNLAYHPYCAYGPYWSCPIPPAENHLNIAMEAGEKLDPNGKGHH